jgi:hypothetical protein
MPADRRTSDGSASFTPYPASPSGFQTPSIPQRPKPSSRPSKGSARDASPGASMATASVPADPHGMPPPLDPHGYKVARAISSCTRCRTRKQKCDGKLPACSACERAKVECIGFDAISTSNVSRK